jgi:hypothetical protein
MIRKVITSPGSVVSSGAFRIQAGSAAREAEAASAGTAHGSSGMGFNLRAQDGRIARNQGTSRIFPGPSARTTASQEPRAAISAEAPAHTQVQHPPYPPQSQSGTVTSLGARFNHSLRSLFS